MPLSEHEQQMLAQMEQALASEDPRFAHQMRSGAASALRRRRLVVGALAVVAGLALVLVGVNTTMWVGAFGFALMVAGAAYAFSPTKGGDQGHDRRRRGGKGGKGGSSGSGLMHRLDERWERRDRGL